MNVKVTSLGINQLVTLDSVCVRQKGAFSGNKYLVTDTNGQPLFHAKEKGGTGSLGGKDRSFNIVLKDNQNKEVITLRRPYNFGSGKMKVTMCGHLVSVVRKEATFFKPVLNINNPQDNLVLKVKGPANTFGESDFKIFCPNKQCIGVIRKVWGSMMREMFTNRDSFQISFPVDLDVRYKATIIGTCILIDFLYYDA